MHGAAAGDVDRPREVVDVVDGEQLPGGLAERRDARDLDGGDGEPGTAAARLRLAQAARVAADEAARRGDGLGKTGGEEGENGEDRGEAGYGANVTTIQGPEEPLLTWPV